MNCNCLIYVLSVVGFCAAGFPVGYAAAAPAYSPNMYPGANTAFPTGEGPYSIQIPKIHHFAVCLNSFHFPSQEDLSVKGISQKAAFNL